MSFRIVAYWALMVCLAIVNGCVAGGDSRPRRGREYRGKHYFGDWTIHKFKPFKPVSLGNPLPREKALQRKVYLKGTYDASGNLRKFVKYSRPKGENKHHRVCGAEYTYGPEGKVETIIGKRYDEEGKLYWKNRTTAEGTMLGQKLTREDIDAHQRGTTELQVRNAFGQPGASMQYGKSTVLGYPDKDQKRGGFCFEFRCGKLVNKVSYSGYFADCSVVGRLMEKRGRKRIRESRKQEGSGE